MFRGIRRLGFRGIVGTAFGVLVVGVGAFFGVRAAISAPDEDLAFRMPDAALASEILADGVVTREEYAAAMAATVECAEAKGVLITEPRFDGRQYQYVISANDLAHEKAFDACYGLYLSTVERAWISQLDANIDQNQIYPQWVECMRSRGYVIGADEEPKEVYDRILTGDPKADQDDRECYAEADPRVTLPVEVDWDRVYARYRSCMAERGYEVPDAVGLDAIVNAFAEMYAEHGDTSELCSAQAELDERLGVAEP